MSEIPKIARARLEQQSAGAGSHPDADQLTAFLERSLGAREREQVLEHLARCAECREVVAVTLTSPPEEAARVAQPAREFRWFEWPAWGGLRWAAVAATLVIAVSLVFQTYRQAPETFSSDAAQSQPMMTPAPAESEPAGPASTTASTEAAKPAEAAHADEAQPRADVPAAKEKAPSSSAVAVLRDQETESVNGPSKLGAVTRARTGQKAGELAGAGIGGRMDDSKLGKEGKAEVGDTFAAKAAAAPSAPAVSAGSLRGPAMQQQQAGALARQSGPPSPPAAREELQRQAAAEPSRAAADQAEAAKLTAQNEALSVESAEKDAPPKAGARNAAPAAGYDELRKLSAASATSRWIINAEGRVQRSTDSGQTWKSTTLAPHLKFRTVAAAGSEVWAGGEGGALYHSSDSGAHWTRVALPAELASVTIVRVEFTDARHGTLTTSAGETWASSDSGATWRKK